jgi:hypothetical protein
MIVILVVDERNKKCSRKMKDNFKKKTEKLVGLMLMDADPTEEI